MQNDNAFGTLALDRGGIKSKYSAQVIAMLEHALRFSVQDRQRMISGNVAGSFSEDSNSMTDLMDSQGGLNDGKT